MSEARSWNAPPFALETGRHGGVLPDALNALSVGPATIVPTAVLPAPGGVLVRIYEASGSRARPVITGERLRFCGLAELDGTPVEELGPFRIGVARCADA